MADSQHKLTKLKGVDSWDIWYDQSVFQFKKLRAWEYINPDGVPEPEPSKPTSLRTLELQYEAHLASLDAAAALARAEVARAEEAARTQSSTIGQGQSNIPTTGGGVVAGGIGGAVPGYVDADVSMSGTDISTPGSIVIPTVPTESERRGRLELIMKRWAIHKREFEDFEAIKEKVLTYFQQTVDPSLYNTFNEVGTMRAMYDIVQDTYKPSETVYSDILMTRYQKLKNKGYNRKTEDWLNEWKFIVKKCQKDCPAALYKASEDFAKAVGVFDSEGKMQLYSMREKFGPGRGNLPDIDTVIGVYTGHWMNTNGDRNKAATVNATLSGPTDDGAASSETTSNDGKPKKKRGCSFATGKPPNEECSSVADCNVMNHNKWPEKKDQKGKWKKYLENY